MDDEQTATAGQQWRVDPLLGKTMEKVKNYLETEHARLSAQYQNFDLGDPDFDPDDDIRWWLDDMKDLVEAMDEFVVDIVADMKEGRDDD